MKSFWRGPAGGRVLCVFCSVVLLASSARPAFALTSHNQPQQPIRSQANLLNETDAIGNEWQATYNLANQVTEIEAPATGNTGSGNANTVPTYLYVGGPMTTETAYDESGSSVRGA